MMMDCRRITEEDVAERYFLGRLTEAELEAFESHFFHCGECFASLEALRAAKAQLENERKGVPRLAQRPRPTPNWWLALAAAVVATFAIVFLVAWTLGSFQ